MDSCINKIDAFYSARSSFNVMKEKFCLSPSLFSFVAISFESVNGLLSPWLYLFLRNFLPCNNLAV